jgi:hypothetical protein
MVLIAQSPGGSEAHAPAYDPAGLPPARFDVLIDDDLQGLDVNEYYLGRARLAAATFRVLVYDRHDYQPVWKGKPSAPKAVLGADEHGQFRLDQAELEPGGEYLWLAIAQVNDGKAESMLWSMPLYFKLLPQEHELPQLLGEDAQPLRVIMVQAAQQARASVAEQGALRRLAPYYNFAVASDSFVCAALTEDGPTPWPDPPAQPALPFKALLSIGDVAAQALACQRARQDPGQLAKLGVAVRGLAQSLAASGVSNGVQALSETGDKLGQAATPEEAAATLSQLMIAIDGAIASGTRPKVSLGLESIPPYSQASVKRIEAIQEYSGRIQAVMGNAQWQLWDAYLRQVRGELTLIAEDVGRGRMNGEQLEEQLARARQIAPPLYPSEWRFVTADGALDGSRLSHLQAEETEQRRRLVEEMYWYHLTRFSSMLFPPAR